MEEMFVLRLSYTKSKGFNSTVLMMSIKVTKLCDIFVAKQSNLALQCGNLKLYKVKDETAVTKKNEFMECFPQEKAVN